MATTDMPSKRPTESMTSTGSNPSPSPEDDCDDQKQHVSTTSPRRSQEAAELKKREQRHSKRLSLNFPILVPMRSNPMLISGDTVLDSPLSHSYVSPGSFKAQTSPMPPTPPSEISEDNSSQMQFGTLSRPELGRKKSSHSRSQTISVTYMRPPQHAPSSSTDFLTMLAGQERKVLELKEELARAENELTSLKRQWALYEAGKKKAESNLTKGDKSAKMINLASTDHARVGSAGLGLDGIENTLSNEEQKAHLEREKKREFVKEMMIRRTTAEDGITRSDSKSKKPGQRVFSSSRHTRTLSLLTSNTIDGAAGADRPTNLVDEETSSSKTRNSRSSTTSQEPLNGTDFAQPPATPSSTTSSRPSLSRAATGLSASFEPLNLGKTYKDLASAASASRRSLPQGLASLPQNLGMSPDVFVKQGKQVVDGVRDGLWTFFEDIRQATVGEEAIHGTADGRPGHLQRRNSRAQPNKQGKENSSDKDSSFWREFGVDTPKSDKVVDVKDRDKTVKSKNSKKKNGGLKRIDTNDSQVSSPSTTGASAEAAEACCPHHGHGRSKLKQKQRQQDGKFETAGTAGNAARSQSPSETVHSAAGSARTRPSNITSDKTGSASKPEKHASKSSTDSQHPPSLITDDNDLLDDDDDDDDEEEEEQEDDGWDDWEVSTNTSSIIEIGKVESPLNRKQQQQQQQQPKRVASGGSPRKRKSGQVSNQTRVGDETVEWHGLTG